MHLLPSLCDEHPTFPHPLPSSGNLLFYSGAPGQYFFLSFGFNSIKSITECLNIFQTKYKSEVKIYAYYPHLLRHVFTMAQYCSISFSIVRSNSSIVYVSDGCCSAAWLVA